jgi:hypothetical protein
MTLRPLPVTGVIEPPVDEELPPRLNAARDLAPKYPAAGVTPAAFCQAITAACVAGPKGPTALGDMYPAALRAFWRQVTSAPEVPTIKSRVNEQDEEVVIGGVVITGALPVREAFTFAIVLESAPNEVRSERMAEVCASVNAAACATGARANTDVIIARPTPTAATFEIALVVIDITIFNSFKRT